MERYAVIRDLRVASWMKCSRDCMFSYYSDRVLLSVLVLLGSIALAFTLTSATIAFGWNPAAKLLPRALTRFTEVFVAAPTTVFFSTTLGWLFLVIVKVTSDSVIW